MACPNPQYYVNPNQNHNFCSVAVPEAVVSVHFDCRGLILS